MFTLLKTSSEVLFSHASKTPQKLFHPAELQSPTDNLNQIYFDPYCLIFTVLYSSLSVLGNKEFLILFGSFNQECIFPAWTCLCFISG